MTYHIYCINTQEKTSFITEEVATLRVAKKLATLYNKTWSLHFCKTKQIRLDENNSTLSCIRYCFSDQDELTYDQCNKLYLKQVKEM